MVKHNLRIHELAGLLLLFIGMSWLGMGLYATVWAATKLDIVGGMEMLFFPIFYGFGSILVALGLIELREALPGKCR